MLNDKMRSVSENVSNQTISYDILHHSKNNTKPNIRIYHTEKINDRKLEKLRELHEKRENYKLFANGNMESYKKKLIDHLKNNKDHNVLDLTNKLITIIDLFISTKPQEVGQEFINNIIELCTSLRNQFIELEYKDTPITHVIFLMSQFFRLTEAENSIDQHYLNPVLFTKQADLFELDSVYFDRNTECNLRQSVKVKFTSNDIKTSSLLCRICESYISKDQFRGHSDTCMQSALVQTNFEKFQYFQSQFIQFIDKAQKKLSSISSTEVIDDAVINLSTDLVHAEVLLPLFDPIISQGYNWIKFDQRQSCEILLNAISVSKESVSKPLQQLLESFVLIIIDRIDIYENMKANQNDGNIFSAPVSSVTINDFRILLPISKGAYAKVYLAQKKKTGDIYAIKVMKKEEIMRKNQLPNIQTEQRILSQSDNPYVVKLYYSLQSETHLFFVMEFVNGGDLFSLLKNVECLSEDVVKIYVSETILALEYLHNELGVIHRDLKPDNILIDRYGHIKLTDFGLSVIGQVEQNTYNNGQAIPSSPTFYGNKSTKKSSRYNFPSFIQHDPIPSPKIVEDVTNNNKVGTPDYMAPEVLLGLKQSYSQDYWSLGVIIYELLVGFPPFNDDTVEKIFSNILSNNINYDVLSEVLSVEAIDLIHELLNTDPKKRIKSPEIRNHPFFKGVDWDHLYEIKDTPFIPTVENEEDTSYFNDRNMKNDDCIDLKNEIPNEDVPGFRNIVIKNLQNKNEEQIKK